MSEPFVMKIRRFVLNIDPSVEVFHVVLEKDDGVWHESFGSEETLRAFLRGVRAGANIASGVFICDPEVPRNAETLKVSLPEEEG